MALIVYIPIGSLEIAKFQNTIVIHVLTWLEWTLMELCQIWFLQILFNQLVEYIAMLNLIKFQKNKSIGQITYEISNEVMDEKILNVWNKIANTLQTHQKEIAKHRKQKNPYCGDQF